MANFIVELIPGSPPHSNLFKGWILNVERESNDKGVIFGIVLNTPGGSFIEYSYSLGFRATNDEAESGPIIAGLKMATTFIVTKLEVRCDSLLIMS